MSIRGSKGGSSSFTQTPDNLRSEDTFEGVLGLCAGRIKGPTRGLKSIKLDDTAIENETGELNFGEFTANIADGDPTQFPQLVQLKLGNGASPVPVQLALSNENTGAGQGTPGPWVTKTVPNLGADFLDVRLIVEQLWSQTKKGIFNETATIEIQMKPSAATVWVNPTLNLPTSLYSESGIQTKSWMKTLVPYGWFNVDGTWKSGNNNYAITGKTTSPTVFEIRIAVPNEDAYENVPWDIRCRLLERETYNNGSDTDNVQENRSISWESVSAVYGSTMGNHEDWRGLAWLQLYGKASDQLTGVPEITGEYDTKIVPVPPSALFNPETRQYTPGVWDGSWAYSFTTDPAWIISDAISDPLSGLSLVASGSYMNKWDALEASKWFSELVPDGDGGVHPRYNMNIAITDTQKAEELLRYMAGAVGALVWDTGNGEWRMKVDKPDAPVDLFTLDNIEDQFVYSHTDVDTRFNDIIGKFKNAAMDYREDSVHLYDNTSIANIGRKPTTIALVGCTNRQEALRRVKLRLRTSVNEVKNVAFVTNRRGRNIEALSTILVADGDLGSQEQRTSSRIVEISSDRLTVKVRDPVYLAPSVAYAIQFAVPNEDYAPSTTSQPVSEDWRKPTVVKTISLTNTGVDLGSTRVLRLDTPLPEDIATNMSLALTAPGLPTIPKLYRVLNVAVDDDGERISISAIEIDTGKWAASDNVDADDSVFQDLRGVVPAPVAPEFGTILSTHRTNTPSGVINTLLAQWQRPSGAYISGFRVRHAINGEALTTVVDRTQIPIWELVNPMVGTHTVEICTISRSGQYSAPLTQQILIDDGPDSTRPSLGSLWKNGSPIVVGYPYLKGDIVVDQGATWIYTADVAWDNTMPPDLPAQENAFWRQIKDATSSQVTLSLSAIVVEADADGTVSSDRLPLLTKATYMASTADVTTSTAWSLTTSNCTASIDTDGLVQVTAIGGGSTAQVIITGTFDGVSLSQTLGITKNVAAGGSSGSKVTSFPTVTSSSYGSDPTATATVTSSSSGKLKFTATLNYTTPQPTSGSRTFTMAAKVVYRAVGGSTWTDADAESVGDAAYSSAYPEPEQSPGYLAFNPTVTGLSASTDYEFGVLLRKYSGTGVTATALGSVTGEEVA